MCAPVPCASPAGATAANWVFAELRTISSTSGRSASSRRNEPKWPECAIRCGQPRFKSIASQLGSTKRAAARRVCASFAAKCATSGRSAEFDWKISLRYAASATNRSECIMGVYARSFEEA